MSHVPPLQTNPIQWSLTIAERSADGKFERAFGGGFFEDSGDIPGYPVLLFTLENSAAGGRTRTSSTDVPGMVADFTKRYERVGAAAEGVTVAYKDCHVEISPGSVWLRGHWTNASAFTFGTFEARLQDPSVNLDLLFMSWWIV